MRQIRRREFLKASIGAAAAVGAPFFLPSCYPINAQVAAIRGDDLDAMTRDAINALGGMKTVVDPGDIVFIKPNFVSIYSAQDTDCFQNGECTKPEIIIAVTEECLKAGAAKVIIGEGSHQASFEWHYAITLDGSTNLVEEAERLSSLYDGVVSLACLETDSPGWVEVPSNTSLGTIFISSLVANADKVISIPVAKTHINAQLTLALKNFIGITPMSRYAMPIGSLNRLIFDHSSPRTIAQVYLDIVKSIEPDLSIIDFSIGIEGNGPLINHGGTTVDMKERLGSWAIIASTDIMAADATAARIMSHNTREVVQLAMGFYMGLGEIRKQSIEMLGEELNNLRVAWDPARLGS